MITATAANYRRSTHFGSEQAAIQMGAFDLDVTLTIANEMDPDEQCRAHGCPQRDCEESHTEIPAPIIESGEVTILLRDGDYHAYGNGPDHWISGALLQKMRRLDNRDFRAACRALLEAAAEASGADEIVEH